MKGLHHQVAKKWGCENLSLWQRLNFFASYLSVRKLRNRGVTMSESRTNDVHGFQWVSTKCRCIYDIISILNFLTCFYKIINSIITLFLSYSGLHKPAEQEDDCQTYSKRLYSVHCTCNFKCELLIAFQLQKHILKLSESNTF